jgi:hypothetical protein
MSEASHLSRLIGQLAATATSITGLVIMATSACRWGSISDGRILMCQNCVIRQFLMEHAVCSGRLIMF